MSLICQQQICLWKMSRDWEPESLILPIGSDSWQQTSTTSMDGSTAICIQVTFRKKPQHRADPASSQPGNRGCLQAWEQPSMLWKLLVIAPAQPTIQVLYFSSFGDSRMLVTRHRPRWSVSQRLITRQVGPQQRGRGGKCWAAGHGVDCGYRGGGRLRLSKRLGSNNFHEARAPAATVPFTSYIVVARERKCQHWSLE